MLSLLDYIRHMPFTLSDMAAIRYMPITCYRHAAFRFRRY